MMAGIWSFQKANLLRPDLSPSCACYCPGCGIDLVSSDGISWHDDGHVVLYWCRCGRKSRWYFDSPVPILLKEAPHDL